VPALACQFRIDPFQDTAARFTTDPLLLMQLEYTMLKTKQEIGFNFVIQLHVGAGSLKQQHTASKVTVRLFGRKPTVLRKRSRLRKIPFVSLIFINQWPPLLLRFHYLIGIAANAAIGRACAPRAAGSSCVWPFPCAGGRAVNGALSIASQYPSQRVP
jgi:hypothetical protein